MPRGKRKGKGVRQRIDATFGCCITFAAWFAHQAAGGTYIDDPAERIGRLLGLAMNGQFAGCDENRTQVYRQYPVEIFHTGLRDR